MSFWRKIFGYSQREIWHQVAKDKGARFIFGTAMEGDKIEYKVKDNFVTVYITTKGNSWYTVFESYINQTDLFVDKLYINSLKKKGITVIPLKETEGRDYYFLQMKDEGIQADSVLLKERMDFFGNAIEKALK